MSKQKLTIIAKIEDDDGNVKTTVESSSEIPSYEDFDKLGFRAAFHEFEGAVLETSREVNTQVSEHYLSDGSKKKSTKREAGSNQKKKKR